MKILTPFNRVDMLGKMVENGAEEFYMGFFDEDWNRKYGNYCDINRLTLFKETANRYTLNDIREVTKEVHNAGAVIYITLNAPGYQKKQFAALRDYVKQLSEFGVDGVITSIPELIPMIKENGMKSVASTMCGIQNADLAEFYKKEGIDRVILPREVNCTEIESIIGQVPGMEYEVFLMRNGCRYSDANCLGLHGGKQGALCFSIRSGQTKYLTDPAEGAYFKNQLKDTHEVYSKYYHEYSCGQCAIYRFQEAGISALKIVGRLDDMEEVAKDVKLTSDNIKIAKNCKNEQEYLEKMRLPGDIRSYCRKGLSCYYPEVRWGEL